VRDCGEECSAHQADIAELGWQLNRHPNILMSAAVEDGTISVSGGAKAQGVSVEACAWRWK